MPLAAAIAGLAVSAAGTGLGIAANAQQQDAMNRTREQEAAAQQALMRKNRAIVNNSMAQSTPENAQKTMQTAQDARTALYNALQNASQPIASALPATGTSSPTGQASESAQGRNNVWTDLVNKAKATEGSYGDLGNEWANNNANANQRLAVNNEFSRQDANLLPVEMQSAMQSGDTLGTWGSLASALGNLAMSASGSGLLRSSPSGVNGAANLGNTAFGNEYLNSANSMGSTSVMPGGSIWKYLYGA